MLAPRKTLWSTPGPVLDHVIATTPLRPSDSICDIGCGDGRCLIQWAQAYSQQQHDKETPRKWPCFLGIDIDSERVAQAQKALTDARANGSIHPEISVTFRCANALQDPTFFSTTSTTILFIYLIPRGLKLLQPYLQDMPHLQTVISYMAPVPHWTVTRIDKIPVQAGTAWPVYVYQLDDDDDDKNDDGNLNDITDNRENE